MNTTLTMMDTREKLVKNKTGTIHHYHNYKKIIENISNEIKQGEENEMCMYITNVYLFANCSMEYDDYNVALEYFNESLLINLLIFGSDEHSSIPETLNNIGLIHYKQEKYDLY